jgi:hypothetical protein
VWCCGRVVYQKKDSHFHVELYHDIEDIEEVCEEWVEGVIEEFEEVCEEEWVEEVIEDNELMALDVPVNFLNKSTN